MNEIKVTVNFKRRKIVTTGVDLTSGDYNSTKLVFDFDTEEGTKIFEMINPNGTLIYTKEIINNEVPLYILDENEQKSSLFNQAGEYKFEVSLYNGDSKLTSATSSLNVQPETVIIGDEEVEAYLPVFDDLMNDIDTAITETNNLDLDVNKEGNTTTVTLTKKDGTTKSVQILDGSGGGGTSDYTQLANKPKINNVELNGNKTLNDLNIQDKLISGTNIKTINNISLLGSGNIDVTGGGGSATWGSIEGTLSDQTDLNTALSNKVSNTDYATSSVGGVVKISVGDHGLNMDDGTLKGVVKTVAQYNDMSSKGVISKGTLENVITGKGLVSSSDLSTVATTGSYDDLSDTPTNVSEFTNDAGYLTTHQDISGKEDKTNKVTSISSSSTDTQYPTAKCVYDIVGDVVTLIDNL